MFFEWRNNKVSYLKKIDIANQKSQPTTQRSNEIIFRLQWLLRRHFQYQTITPHDLLSARSTCSAYANYGFGAARKVSQPAFLCKQAIAVRWSWVEYFLLKISWMVSTWFDKNVIWTLMSCHGINLRSYIENPNQFTNLPLSLFRKFNFSHNPIKDKQTQSQIYR